MTARTLLPSSSFDSFGVSPRKAELRLDIGHTRLYELINSGKLESYKDGRSRKITVRSIDAYVESRLEAERAAGPAATPISAAATPATAPAPMLPPRRKRGRPGKLGTSSSVTPSAS